MDVPGITGLSLRNFRGFKKATEIPLSGLTFLVGPNSSGKSSVSDAIMLIAQSGIIPKRFDPSFDPQWIGRLVDLGSFGDTVFKHNLQLAINIEFDISLDPKTYWSFFESSNKLIKYSFNIKKLGSDGSSLVRSIKISDVLTREELSINISPGRYLKIEVCVNGKRKAGTQLRTLSQMDSFYRSLDRFLEELISKPGELKRGKKAGWKRIRSHIHSSNIGRFMTTIARVSSGRSGPQRWYVPRDQGPKSRFTPGQAETVFDSLSPEMVDNAILGEQNAIRSRHFRALIQKTKFEPPELRAILKELGIGDQILPETYTPYHSMLNIRDHIIDTDANISDVGYGASQVIPVIAACTTLSRSPLIVEQPEIHLHPRAQGVVGNLLCNTSKLRQVIVETHSAHMINQARILVAKGEMSPEHVSILYVDRDARGTKVTHIPLDENGDFAAHWPAGFFDERYEETMQLIELQQAEKNRRKS